MKKITLAELEKLAKEFEIPLPHVRAVVEVESNGDGFLSDGRPKILFERHKFFQFTKGKFSANAPDLCHKSAGGYATGATSEIRGGREWSRLATAMVYDRESAICSCSWGMGQVMGYHWKTLGYASAQAFVNAMYLSEYNQLVAMFRYICHSPSLKWAAQVGDWVYFARYYNGKNYAKNRYDIKLKTAADKFKKAA